MYLDFKNTEANHLGMPLPKGTVPRPQPTRAAPSNSSARIPSITRRATKIRIKMGEAFDVVADRKQMEWKVLGSCQSESTWEIELRNHKDEAVRVEVREPAGGDWTMMPGRACPPRRKTCAEDLRVRRAGAEARRDQSEVSGSRALVLTLASAGLRVEVLDPVVDTARLGSRATSPADPCGR